MLEICRILDSNLLEVTVKGEVTLDELNKFDILLCHTIQRHTTARMLIQAEGKDGLEVAPFWLKLKRHSAGFSGVTQVAVVADPIWAKLLEATVKHGSTREVNHFRSGEEEGARSWIEANSEQQKSNQPASPPSIQTRTD